MAEEKVLGEEFKSFEREPLKMFWGFLSADPEMRYFDNGGCVCNFSLPLKKNKDDQPVWLNCVANGALAEFIGESYKKGSAITVQGYFKETEYKDKKYVKLQVLFAQ